jgi:hypothetical protein
MALTVDSCAFPTGEISPYFARDRFPRIVSHRHNRENRATYAKNGQKKPILPPKTHSMEHLPANNTAAMAHTVPDVTSHRCEAGIFRCATSFDDALYGANW